MKHFTFWFIFLITPIILNAQGREVVRMNDGWDFQFGYELKRNAPRERVQLPHTWNAAEVMSGKPTYYRGTGNYTRQWLIKPEWKGKRLFLHFEGVNSVANVFINQRWIGEHQGGYTAFCLEVTDHVRYGEENLITVQASNAYNPHVLPISGDFNVYGGIHRPVSLIITGTNCITPLDYASSGVYLKPLSVSEKKAEVQVTTKLSRQSNGTSLRVRTTVRNAEGTSVVTQTTPAGAESTSVSQPLAIASPHLWNGKADPYVYQVTVELLENEQVIDRVTQPLGLRYFSLDAEKGFFLNGKYLDLHGVCRHEDQQGKTSALDSIDHAKDMALITEMGATALRLTHYPHSNTFYNLCDRNGLVVWTEIPLVGPGGYTGAGYIRHPVLEQHARQVMTEMIRQNYNHPSIFFWGLFNELKLDYDDPVPFLQSLDSLVKREDGTRLSTCATFLDTTTFNHVSDGIAWNKYYGWYGGEPRAIGSWADDTHQKYPAKPIAIGEYGAGGSVKQHSEKLQAPDPGGRFHPEEWQTYYHEQNWNALRRRPFVWGKFIWVLGDFGSVIRAEGDTVGINDKGLVTYDRQVRKDAFYFYKANWNPEPMLYLTGRRHTLRTEPVTEVKVYGNVPEAELFVNGQSAGKQRPNDLNMMVWPQVRLRPGKNKISVKAKTRGKTLSDSCEWVLQ